MEKENKTNQDRLTTWDFPETEEIHQTNFICDLIVDWNLNLI